MSDWNVGDVARHAQLGKMRVADVCVNSLGVEWLLVETPIGDVTVSFWVCSTRVEKQIATGAPAAKQKAPVR